MLKELLYEFDNGWGGIFDRATRAKSFSTLDHFLREEFKSGETIYPAQENIFNSFKMTPYKDVRVVILGQDPYHGPGQAHGLSFSVQRGVKIPPSLRNIYKEINLEYGDFSPKDGELSNWAKQGVLLLNATLSVRAAQAGSHQKKGWEDFTDEIIRGLNDSRDNIVFLLWGSYAQKKKDLINQTNHLVLEAPHPSPLSAHRGFLGCNHFKLANEYLTRHGRGAIDWKAL